MGKEQIIKEFVKQFYKEKQSLYNDCFKVYIEGKNGHNGLVTKLVADLNLTEEQYPVFEDFVSALLTDTFYTILLGLDGEATIGDCQQTYTIIDEKGNDLSGGYIETYAYEYFHGGMQEESDR
ncbi:hypothetical protein D0T84_13585 [Dysgonomonas sp. 521]|uniref:hypothetical protein n=1 Tax=Dysgonomonas sp. 521 TaxID=2302932 RepID=UPI0013D43E1B|nr:hypothetical protein [Dysgonomonas sp. 521]NDV95935.1 hypothetical protein [Dysgonomonas sp. 521]